MLDWQSLKENGNTCFRDGNIPEAIDLYSKALVSVTKESEHYLALLCNRALCYNRENSFQEALQDCNRALDVNPVHMKALFRRGEAYYGLSKYTEAIMDFKKCLNLVDANQVSLKKQLYSRITKASGALEQQDDLNLDVMHLMSTLRETTKDVDCIKTIGLIMKRPQLDLLGHGFVDWAMNTINNSSMSMLLRGETARALNSLMSGLSYHSAQCLAVNLNTDALCRTINTILGLEKEHRPRLISILTHMCSHDPLMKCRIAVLETLSTEIELSQSNLHANLDKFSILCDIFSSIATSPPASVSKNCLDEDCLVDSEIRNNFLHLFLFSPGLIRGAFSSQVRNIIIGCLVLCTGRPQVAAKLRESGSVASKEREDGDTKPFDKDLLQRVETRIAPLVLSKASSKYSVGLRALGAILQAAPKIGNMVVNVDGVLQRIVEVAVMDPAPHNALGAEVLALSSSDTAVRKALVEGDFMDVFFDLLDYEDDYVRSHASIALAKFSLADTNVEALVLRNHRVLNKMYTLLKRHVQSPQPLVLDKTIELAIEAIAYLSTYVETKTEIAISNDSSILKTLVAIMSESSSLLYGIVQIFNNLSTSEEDMKEEYSNEMEQLKRVAAKGLDMNKEKQRMESRAGSVEVIDRIRFTLVDTGAVASLTSKDGNRSESMNASLANLLMKLASVRDSARLHEIRGRLVQQGALRLLLDLSSGSSEKSILPASLAITRIAISTNPNLYPVGVAEDMIPVVLKFVTSSTHELHMYESLLAIGNLASIGDEIRSVICLHNGWRTITNAVMSENPLIQRASVQAQANMIYTPDVIKRLSTSRGGEDLKILLAFCTSDDMAAVSAATGALAMASAIPDIAKQIVAHGGIERLVETALDPEVAEDEGILLRVKTALDNLVPFKTNEQVLI